MQVQKVDMLLKYDPVDRKNTTKRSTPWWLLASSGCDLDAYLAWFFKKKTGIELQRPQYGAHVSIVKGEEPFNKDLWRSRQDQLITVYLDLEVRSSGPEFVQIRQEFGLTPFLDMTFHVTMGYPMPSWAEESRIVHKIWTKNTKPAKLPWTKDLPNVRYILEDSKPFVANRLDENVSVCLECERGLIFDNFLVCLYCGRKYHK
jgi:hypothetical protein